MRKKEVMKKQSGQTKNQKEVVKHNGDKQNAVKDENTQTECRPKMHEKNSKK